MASFVKALLVVGALLLVLAIVAGVGGYYWYSRHGRQFMDSARQANVEGAQFGEETDDQGCLDEALARHKKARGLGASIVHNLFLKGCFTASERTAGFCDGVPKRLDILESSRWQIRRCSAAGFNDSYCRQLFAEVQEYCESGMAEPAGGDGEGAPSEEP